jgi:hypothetical protein
MQGQFVPTNTRKVLLQVRHVDALVEQFPQRGEHSEHIAVLT